MHLVLAVVGLPFEDVAAQDFKKHGEPEEMQRAHRAQEHRGEIYEWLELGELGGVLGVVEDEPDHLRQAVDASDEPSDHTHDESDGARVLIDEAVEAFGHPTKNVCKVVQVGNDRAERHHIAKYVTEIKRNCRNMMQKHFFEVIMTCRK